MIPDWQNIQRVVYIRPDNMGDVIMSSPAIRALKETYPHLVVSLCSSTQGGKIGRYIPEVDEIITIDLPWIKNELSEKGSVAIENLVAILKRESYDAAIIGTTYSQSCLPTALLTYMADIPVRVGYARENPYDLLTTWVPDEEPYFEIKHEVQRQLDLVAAVGASASDNSYSLMIPDCPDLFNKLRDSTNYNPDAPWLIMHTGASEGRRRFNPDTYVQVAQKLIHDHGYQVFLTGVASEKDTVDAVQKQTGTGAFSIAGAVTLDEFICLLHNSPVIISNNSGPVHLAAAVKTPVVVLYARTNPQHAPWKVPYTALCYDIPVEERSQNRVLKYTYPSNTIQPPTADTIVEAALKHINNKIEYNTNQTILW